MQHGDWRRSVAALLGRFLPKLRATRKGGLFSVLGCPVLADPSPFASRPPRIDVQSSTKVCPHDAELTFGLVFLQTKWMGVLLETTLH